MSLKRVQNVLHEVKSVFNDPRVKKTMKLGSMLATAYAGFAEKPTWWNGAKACMSVLKDLTEDHEVWAYDYFDDDEGWTEPFNRDFNGAFLKILVGYPHLDIKTNSDHLVIRLHDVEDVQFGYVLNTKFSGRVDKVYCKADKYKRARELLRKLLWDQFGGQSLVMRKSDRFGFKEFDEDKVILEIDQVYKAMPSKRATEYSKYLKRCIDAGVHRSVMFYGPPGTGKSTTAKTIVETLGLRSFRIRVADAGGIDNSTLFESVKIFQPEAIIFDDFDRAHNQENLLETLEHFHDNVKLVIATVNRRNDLDEALLRPGRFDELECVKRMDDDVVKKVLGDENLDAFEMVKEWPIAFIQEYVKRTHFMSKEEAIESVEELAERVDRLSEFDEDNDFNRVLSRRKRKGEGMTEEDVARIVAQFQQQSEQLTDEGEGPPSDLWGADKPRPIRNRQAKTSALRRAFKRPPKRRSWRRLRKRLMSKKRK